MWNCQVSNFALALADKSIQLPIARVLWRLLLAEGLILPTEQRPKVFSNVDPTDCPCEFAVDGKTFRLGMSAADIASECWLELSSLRITQKRCPWSVLVVYLNPFSYKYTRV